MPAAQSASTPPVFLSVPREKKDRAESPGHYLLGHTAHEQLVRTGAPMRAHDEVNVLVAGGVEDTLKRHPVHERSVTLQARLLDLCEVCIQLLLHLGLQSVQVAAARGQGGRGGPDLQRQFREDMQQGQARLELDSQRDGVCQGPV
jgi:hypothetical protein